MLRSLNLLVGTPVQAPDGEAGSVESVLFDDEQWVVRYLVLGAAGLGGKRLLVSPYGLEAPTADRREFRLRVTRDRLQHAPEFTPDAPVSREWERGYLRFFAWPLYWGGGSSGLWGAGNYPGLLFAAPTASDPTPDVGVGAEAEHEERAEATSHLHPAESYKGYAVTADDGTEIGEIDDFLVDDQTWALAYVAVHSPGWLGGKRILVPAESFGDAALGAGMGAARSRHRGVRAPAARALRPAALSRRRAFR